MTKDDGRRALELLLIADVHFVREARHECPIPARKAALGLELVRRARLWEVGELSPHLELMRKIVPDEALPSVLYRADAAGRGQRHDGRT